MDTQDLDSFCLKIVGMKSSLEVANFWKASGLCDKPEYKKVTDKIMDLKQMESSFGPDPKNIFELLKYIDKLKQNNSFIDIVPESSMESTVPRRMKATGSSSDTSVNSKPKVHRIYPTDFIATENTLGTICILLGVIWLVAGIIGSYLLANQFRNTRVTYTNDLYAPILITGILSSVLIGSFDIGIGCLLTDLSGARAETKRLTEMLAKHMNGED